MCMLDGGDDLVQLLSVAEPVARKTHKCKECWREIAPGERYHVDRFVLDGRFKVHKTCAHCMVARQWLSDECGGWMYGGVKEDIREHAQHGSYPMSLHRLAVGMAWKWRTPKGRLLPAPGKSKISEDRVHENY